MREEQEIVARQLRGKSCRQQIQPGKADCFGKAVGCIVDNLQSRAANVLDGRGMVEAKSSGTKLIRRVLMDYQILVTT